jgi:hypothetical protein
MNVPAALIATGFGAAFFVAELTFHISSSFIFPDRDLVLSMFTTNHAKAREAVSRLLISPGSAQFSTLRSVEADAAKYVCGEVKAKDRSGYYAEYRDFVYTVATNSARIDDDGLIAQKHGEFTSCPVLQEEKPAPQTMPISPDALAMVKNIQKIMPSADPSALSTLASQMPAGGERSSGASLEQQVGEMASQMTRGQLTAGQAGSANPSGPASRSGSAATSGSTGQQQANSTFKAAPGDEGEWRSDQPPAAWPTFPPDHPLARSAQKRTTEEAMALAKDIEDRWEQSRSGNPKARPSSGEIQEACRALLAIDPNDREFRKAWSTFVRLQKINRDASS